MKVVCSGCKKVMGEKAGPTNGPVSHSICRECWKVFYPEITPFPECELEWKALEERGS